MNPEIIVGSRVRSTSTGKIGTVTSVARTGVTIQTDDKTRVWIAAANCEIVTGGLFGDVPGLKENPTTGQFAITIDPMIVIDMPDPFCLIEVIHVRPDRVCEARDRKGNLITLMSSEEVLKVFRVDPDLGF